MFQGNFKAALCCLSNHSRRYFLPLTSKVGDSTVFDELMKNNPPPSTDIPLVAGDTPFESCHPIIFESLDDVVIRKAVLCTKGSSGMDVQGWWHLFRMLPMILGFSGALNLYHFCWSSCPSTTFKQPTNWIKAEVFALLVFGKLLDAS